MDAKPGRVADDDFGVLIDGDRLGGDDGAGSIQVGVDAGETNLAIAAFGVEFQGGVGIERGTVDQELAVGAHGAGADDIGADVGVGEDDVVESGLEVDVVGGDVGVEHRQVTTAGGDVDLEGVDDLTKGSELAGI